MTTLDTPSATTNAPIWNTALRWGLWSGLAGIALSLLMYLFDYNPMMSGFGGMAIMFVIIFAMVAAFIAMALRQYRDRENGGYLKYGTGLLIATVMGAVSGFLGQVWEYILSTVIDPDRMAKMGQAFEESWGDKMPPEAMEEALKQFENGPQVMTIFTSGLLGGAVIGLILGLIVAAVMKREPKLS